MASCPPIQQTHPGAPPANVSRAESREAGARWRGLAVLVLGLLALPGRLPAEEVATFSARMTVRVDAPWTDTGLDVPEGGRLQIEASGSALVVGTRLWDWLSGPDMTRRVGPEGTFLWPLRYRRHATSRPFPLPAMADGPFPAFCLVGKIGEQGQPFHVGARHDRPAQGAGRLWLGINDDYLEDNRGQFDVVIRLGDSPAAPAQPAGRVPEIDPSSRPGRPIQGARVLMLYVDGLRPDVLHEMAQAGFLPNVQHAFLESGVEIPQAFSVFPSNTLIANGSLFTGRFSDRTGIKSQNQFERSTLLPRGQLSEWLPDGFIRRPATRVMNLLDKYAPENTHEFLLRRGVPTLASRLGKAYRFTTLPIAPLNPPPGWFHRAINTIGPFNIVNRLPQQLDRINASYAIDEILGDPDARVITVWLPMADKVSHHSRRGQFGAARRELALADQRLGEIVTRLREVGWERGTYLILVSDHGHLGGETTVNRVCNLARDWAHRALGCNVRVVGQEWIHPGISPLRFLFFDNQGAGQAKLFLPAWSYFHGPWRRNTFFQLTHYQVRPDTPSMNLVESIAGFAPPGWDGRGPKPVDLVLVKLDRDLVLVYRDARTQALIHTERDAEGIERFRYEPMQAIAQERDQPVSYQPALPGLDPLGYLQDAAFLEATGGAEWLAQAHTAGEWLLATHRSRYPDAVVTMAKFFAWQAPVANLEPLRDPDLMVTASEGWSLRSDDEQGTDHGYPLAESMRITLAIAGPGIAPGRLSAPHRIIDVLPTILEMVGAPISPGDLDGEPIQGLYE